jgi:hypothetical protein
VLALVVLALLVLVWYVITRKLPPADWRASFDADAHGQDVSEEQIAAQIASMRGFRFTIEQLEKTFLLALVLIIFTRIIPGTAASPLEQAISVGIFLLINASLSDWIVRRRERGWNSTATHFAGLMAINTAIVLVYRAAMPGERSFHIAAALFFVSLLTVLLTFYERYRPIYLARFGDSRIERRAAKRLGIPAE